MGKKWKCITESGGEYIVEEGGRAYKTGDGSYAGWKVVDRGKAKSMTDVFSGTCNVPNATEPLVGYALYASSFSAWRLSTNVVSVEEVDASQ